MSLVLTRSLLQLLDSLLSEAETEAGELKVIPVLVSDLELHLPALRSIVLHAGGSFLAASDGGGDTIEGPVDAGLTAIVEAAIRLPRPQGEELTARVVTEGENRVRVELSGATDEVLPPGLATLQGVASAVLDPRLHSSTLSAIAYGEGDLEPAGQIAAWSLLTEQLPRHQVGSLRTLVIFLGVGDVEYQRHLGGEVAARYRITSSGWSRRNSPTVSLGAVIHTRNDRSPWNVWFLGAGFAASSDLPLGNELRDFALGTVLGDDGSTSPRGLAELFHRQLVENDRLLAEERALSVSDFVDRLTLERVLREERRWHEPAAMPTLIHFAAKNAAAAQDRGEAVKRLGEWLRSSAVPAKTVIVTVNFDELIEAEVPELIEVFATEERFAECPEYLAKYQSDGGRIPLLKLHGTISEPASVVANVDETLLGLTAPRQDSLRALAKRNEELTSWTYVGYSMRDLDIVPVLRELVFAEATEERWVSPFPDDHVARFAQLYRLDAWIRNHRAGFRERAISLSADAYFTHLAELATAGR